MASLRIRQGTVRRCEREAISRVGRAVRFRFSEVSAIYIMQKESLLRKPPLCSNRSCYKKSKLSERIPRLLHQMDKNQKKNQSSKKVLRTTGSTRYRVSIINTLPIISTPLHFIASTRRVATSMGSLHSVSFLFIIDIIGGQLTSAEGACVVR